MSRPSLLFALSLTGALILVLTLAACDAAGPTTSSTPADRASAKGPRIDRPGPPRAVDLCHYDAEADSYKLLTLPEPALQPHLAHGDALPGEPVPTMEGFVFDAACVPVATDGGRVAFESFRDGNWQIYVIDADGTNLTRLTDNAAIDIRPSISADRQRVAFMSNRDGNEEIYVVDVGSKNLTRLTTNGTIDSEPSFGGGGSAP